MHGWRPGIEGLETLRADRCRGSPAPGGGAGPRMTRERAHTHGRARARAWAPSRPGRQAGEVGEGSWRRRPPGGRRWPQLPWPPLRSRAAFCLRVLLSPPEEEGWQGLHRAGPGRHLKAAGAQLGNREQGGDPAGLPRLAQLALPLGHWTLAGGWGGRDRPVRVGVRGGARTKSALLGVRVGGAGVGMGKWGSLPGDRCLWHPRPSLTANPFLPLCPGARGAVEA